MSSSLDDLERQAEERKKKGAARNPGGSRNPRKPPSAEELQAREAEMLRRQQEREAAAKAAEDAEAEARRQAEAAKAKESQRDDVDHAGDRRASAVRKRPASTPFYPDADNEEFLWQIQEAAAARREKVPATAVLRFALRRLEQEMTPMEIVRRLGGPVQTEGKMGRPRR